MNKDDLLIFEAYKKTQQIDEAGAIARAGANLAAMGKNMSFGNMGTRLAGAAARGLGKVVGGAGGQALTQAGQQLKQQATSAGNDAKITQILKTHKADIDKLSQAIVTDLDKLKLNTTGIKPEALATPMFSQVDSLLKKQMGAVGATPEAPAPTETAPAPTETAPEAPAPTETAPEAPAPTETAPAPTETAPEAPAATPSPVAVDAAATMAAKDGKQPASPPPKGTVVKHNKVEYKYAFPVGENQAFWIYKTRKGDTKVEDPKLIGTLNNKAAAANTQAAPQNPPAA
jgi:hypothetical protein